MSYNAQDGRPTVTNYLAPNVIRVKAEKHWSRIIQGSNMYIRSLLKNNAWVDR